MERSGSFRRIFGGGGNDSEGLVRSSSDVSRKRSMVKPERQRISKDDPHYYYNLVSEESMVKILPSSTGNEPYHNAERTERVCSIDEETPILPDSIDLERGISSASKTSKATTFLHRSNSTNRKNYSSSRREDSPKLDSAQRLHYQPKNQDEDGVQTNMGEGHTEDQEYGNRVLEFPDVAPSHEPQAADSGPGIPIESQEHTYEPRSSVEWKGDYEEKSPLKAGTHNRRDKKFDLWQTYCRVLTFPVAPKILSWFGMGTPERQMAWREKIGLISCIVACGAVVGFLTFGFTQSVCKNNETRIRAGSIQSNEVVAFGSVYDLGSYSHPAVNGISDRSPILYPPVNAGGMDISFLFQNVNGYCTGLITPKASTSIPSNPRGEMGWYFPCQLIHMNNNTLKSNADIVNANTNMYNGWGCHTQSNARGQLYSMKRSATLYYTWEDLRKTTEQLINFNGDVLNLRYLDHLLTGDLDYPALFDVLKNDTSLRGRDISQEMSYGEHRRAMNCLRQITKVGEIDTEKIGCIASKVVLYVSLVFIMGLVIVKFLVACYFRFFMARYQGAFAISESQFKRRERNIEDWGDDIYTSAEPFQESQTLEPQDMSRDEFAQINLRSPGTPTTISTRLGSYPAMVGAQFNSQHVPFSRPPSASKRKSLFMDRLTQPHSETAQRITDVTMSTQNPELSSSKVLSGQSLQHQPLYRQSVYSRPGTLYDRYGGSQTKLDEDVVAEEISMTDLAPPSILGGGIDRGGTPYSIVSEGEDNYQPCGPVGGASEYIVPQPPLDFQPFGYPLAHVICMVTAYSESIEGLRTTLDSICTTEYPNSHKLVAIVCDGIIKGSGNDMSTPEICLSMITDFSEPVESVQAYSYVSVVSGEKRHNMAKVYSGFYSYDDFTVSRELQQRVPIICIVKCGTPKEANAAKPGNRGKRDSQVILMSFLQHIMFDERMTELDYEIFNGIRSVTGIAPDYYEMMLMVDADTKVFPDCLTHMCAEMVHDPEVMGLCGETKIANKRQSWVTMIQVFEYFISHHQAKGFESVFGSVSCLPGCFSMYRIKAPKGADGYWVPILCNPDIVERYSDNVIDTLHRKNLLLLGEDRYLSTLMAKTFPKRKTIFVPKAACKTVVPDEFKVLLSQRRRWINSTIHNLFELVLVREACGVFVISMQFVVFIDLISTLVLPAAIAFTLYVVILSIVSKPTPILSLILLAMILGLPGVLIVVTATRASYLLWMGIYLLALPIWNFVLPMYAYWKFDDFSWGETRAIAGGDKGHEEANGEFDSSQIVMKRWTEFQNDRARGLSARTGSNHDLLENAL